MNRLLATAFAAVLLLIALPSFAQSVEVEPATPSVTIGETLQVDAFYVDAEGNRSADATVIFYSPDAKSLTATRSGELTALQPGQHQVYALRPAADGQERIVQPFMVTVPSPPVASLTFGNMPDRIYANTTVAVEVVAKAENGMLRDDVETDITSDAEDVATVDAFGRIHAHEPGTATLTARADGFEATATVTVVENPVATLELTGGAESARTGDVLAFDATPLDADGKAVTDAPVRYAVRTHGTTPIAPGATAEIGDDGRFVAEAAGMYTVVATSGPFVAERTVSVEERNLEGSFELVGRGQVSDVHTSDLWVWEAEDGRDYAITGTWGGNGEAYFWDVTDPANIAIVDTVTVDARTVNDVKVSEDGRTCIISREGASDRKNGIVILDCTDPTDVSIITEYTDRLTGGVHNLFIYEDHVYALSASQRYEILNIEDRSAPEHVATFQLDTPGASIHDVWVMDGIAYSSNWDDGVVLVDVGNGVKGGSPSNPVEIGRYTYPSGWNHAAFPYNDAETGKKWVIGGDEAFPNGLNIDDEPTIPAGWLHFIDFTDPENPTEDARYEVPEAGTHNYWVDGDLLYVAYYNAGLRVVDLSGDLKGDLYEQGREIARFRSFDPEGRVANAPMAWGPQPHKGHIFFSDWNSGLWVVKFNRPTDEDMSASRE